MPAADDGKAVKDEMGNDGAQMQRGRNGGEPYITMRMNFMCLEELCTVIDVDFMHKKIYIENKTDDILHRAFGIVEHPDWERFEEFLESRCFPRTRAHVKEILRSMGLDSYDPLQIIEKTGGRMAEDKQWIEIIYMQQ